MAKSKMPKIQQKKDEIRLRLYTRVSTDRQAEEGYSLAIQKEKLRAYAASMDHVAEIKLYEDDGYSGGSLDRPAMQELIREAQQGEITHVAVMKLDRLSRSLKDTMYLIEDVFLPNNIAFISLYESFDTGTPFGRAMVGILSVFAQFERENIYERTRGGMQKRVEAGYWPGGGGVPFGYDYDAAQGILVPNSDAGKVRLLYERYLAGESLQSIADLLGLKYEKFAYNILTRKSNAGYIVYNGVEYRGRHEAIISEETYFRAMSLLKERSERRLVSKTRHLLTGMVRCGKCGARMRYAKWGKNGYKLVCYSRQRSKQYLVHDPNCDQEAVWAEEVEQGVLNALFEAVSNEKLVKARKMVESGDVEAVLHGRLEQERNKLRRLYRLYGEDGDEILLETIETVKQQIEALELELRCTQENLARVAEIRGIYGRLEQIEDIWPLLSVEEQRTILISVLEGIKLTDTKAEIQFKVEFGSY